MITKICDLDVSQNAMLMDQFPVKMLMSNALQQQRKRIVSPCGFKAWGAEIDGRKGTAAAPQQLRQQVWQQVWQLIRLILCGGWCGKHILQQLMGYVGFAFRYRSELYSLAHHVYKYIDGLDDGAWYRLPPQVCDELRSIALCQSLSWRQMLLQLRGVLLVRAYQGSWLGLY